MDSMYDKQAGVATIATPAFAVPPHCERYSWNPSLARMTFWL